MKLFVFAVLTLLIYCGCGKEKVDTMYMMKVDQLNVSANIEYGKDSIVIFLHEKKYIDEFEMDGDSRAENDKAAILKYDERLKSLQKESLKTILTLGKDESVSVSLTYILSRGDEILRDSVVLLK